MSQLVFINTESGFGTSGGNQFDSWKININQSPFTASDSQQLKLTLKQFQCECNWYNVNETNNTFRVYIPANNPITDTFTLTDTLMKIPVGNYVSKGNLLTVFAQQLVLILDSADTAGSTITITTPTIFYTESASNNNGTIPTTADPNFDILGFTLNITGGGSFINQFPIIQCLQIPISTSSPYTQAEQFNDSYILTGGKRIETYETVATTPSFSVFQKPSSTSISIDSFFLMNNVNNTLPYLYLNCETARNQASSNMIAGLDEHAHEVSYSSILAKIPRIDYNTGVAERSMYKLETDMYSCMISTRMLNSLKFSITDHRGRPIPQVADDAKSLGNMICNFAIQIDTINVPFSPNLLISQPPPKQVGARGYIPVMNLGNLNTVN